MQIELNGEKITTAATNLRGLVQERGFDAASVATAVNGSFVPRGKREQAALTAGAKIEVLSPMQGG